MSLANIPDKNDIPSREEVVNLIISSIAMEELGLSHIIDAEGEKLQYALGTIEGVDGLDTPLTMDELLKLNDSIRKTLDSTMMNQFLLKEKLLSALSASIMQGPEGPRGEPGPATISIDPVVENLEPGESPYVNNDQGTVQDVILKFGIPRGEQGPVGTILGSYDSFEALVAEHSSGSQGDMYIAGGMIYVWNTDSASWQQVGDFCGPQGVGTTIKGQANSKAALDNDYPNGPPEDAYLVNGEIYIWNSTDKWHSAGSLMGPAGATGEKGDPGEQGIQGIQGEMGPQGLPSATGIVQGTYATEADMRTDNPSGGTEGDFFLVGDSVSGFDLYIWDLNADPDPDWTNIGSFSGIVGPQGPQGQAGEQGPAGHFIPGENLFNVTNQVGNQSVPFEGTLAFKSDTLNVSIEAGPAVRIERPYRVGTVLNYSSGGVQTLTTGISGLRERVVVIGQGDNYPIPYCSDDPIDIRTTFEFAFPMPASGVIHSLSAFFTLSSGTGLIGNFDTRVVVALCISNSPPNNDFYVIPGSMTTLTVPNNASVGSVYTMFTEHIDVPVNALDRLLLIAYSETAPEYVFTSTISGYISAGVEII